MLLRLTRRRLGLALFLNGGCRAASRKVVLGNSCSKALGWKCPKKEAEPIEQRTQSALRARRPFPLPVTNEGLAGAAVHAAPVVLAVAGLAAAAKFFLGVRGGLFGFDFAGTIWQASRDVLAGRSPYPAPEAHALLLKGNPAVYPPAIFLVASPLALLPLTLATAVWDLMMSAGLAVALRLVGVRDWRIYAVVFLSFPFIASMVLGQIDGLLALGCALAWRYRDRTIVAAIAVAGVIATKLFLWPLALWLLVTGRRRAALGAVSGAAALMLGAWAAIGFDGLRQYPRLLAELSDAFQNRGYSAVASALRAGLAVGPARLLAPLAGVALLLLTLRLARLPFGEDRAFAAAVAAGIFSSPIVWMHSMLIFFVAFAIVRRHFSAAWLTPLAFWLAQHEPPSLSQFVAGQCLMLIMLGLALRAPRALPVRLVPV